MASVSAAAAAAVAGAAGKGGLSATPVALASDMAALPPPSAATIAAVAAATAAEVPVDVTFGDVSTANFHIRTGGGIQRTLCHHSRKISNLLNMKVYFKNEFQHPTGSFKERGGRNALLMMDKEARKRGVIAASAGNHALALAYHGQEMGIPVTVVMPKIAPITKVQNCRELNANVLIQGQHIGEAREYAMALGREHNMTYINGFDHPHVIAGAGTLGVEIIEQVPDVEAVVIPVGGAGLIAGTALAIKTLRPEVMVIGVEPATVPSLSVALERGHPVTDRKSVV